MCVMIDMPVNIGSQKVLKAMLRKIVRLRPLGADLSLDPERVFLRTSVRPIFLM